MIAQGEGFTSMLAGPECREVLKFDSGRAAGVWSMKQQIQILPTYEFSQVWTNPELVPLAAGHRPHVIAIEPRTITGRELIL